MKRREQIQPQRRALRLLRFLRAREWELVGMLALLTLGLGAWGYAEAGDALMLDAFYRSLQLFALESGAGIATEDWQLDVARFLAPAIAGYAIVRAAVVVLRDHLRSLALRRLSGHVIVAGLGPEGVQMVRAFTASGENVIAVAEDPSATAASTCDAHGATPVTGSLSSPETFRRIRMHRAKYAFIVSGRDARSVEAGEAALRVAESRRGSRLQIFVQVSEPRLRIHLAAHALMRQRPRGPTLDIFDAFDVAARTLIEQRGEFLERTETAEAPGAVIAGLGVMGEALTLHVALAWQRARGYARERVRLTLVDGRASETAERLRLYYPQIAEICELDPRDEALGGPTWSSLGWPFPGTRPNALFLCGDEDEQVMSPALAAHRWLRGSGVPITVCVTSTAGTLQSILDDLTDPTPITYSVIEIACAPELVLRGTRELLARATHNDYVRHERERGESSMTNPAVVPWDELPERLRHSNRDQADHLSFNLGKLDCILVPAPFTGSEHARVDLDQQEIERLARAEHDRWVEERRAGGWMHGSHKDIDTKVHASLVPWEELPESEKEKDRDAIRDMPRRLEQAGFALIRV